MPSYHHRRPCFPPTADVGDECRLAVDRIVCGAIGAMGVLPLTLGKAADRRRSRLDRLYHCVAFGVLPIWDTFDGLGTVFRQWE